MSKTDSAFISHTGRIADNISNIAKLIIGIVIFIGTASKAYYDISSNTEKIRLTNEQFEKRFTQIEKDMSEKITRIERTQERHSKKLEENAEKLNKVKIDVAVNLNQTDSIIRQNTAIIIKLEKLLEKVEK